jgi:hypothetical protein
VTLFYWVTVCDVLKGSVPFVFKCLGFTIYGHRTLKIYSTLFSETSGKSYPAAQRHILADWNSPIVRSGEDKTDFCSSVVKYEPVVEKCILKVSQNARRPGK